MAYEIDLHGQVAIITGAAKGIGEASARRLRGVVVGTDQPGPVQTDELLAIGRYLGILEAQMGRTGGAEADLFVQRIAESFVGITPNGDSASLMTTVEDGPAQEGAAALFNHISSVIEVDDMLRSEFLSSYNGGLNGE